MNAMQWMNMVYLIYVRTQTPGLVENIQNYKVYVMSSINDKIYKLIQIDYTYTLEISD